MGPLARGLKELLALAIAFAFVSAVGFGTGSIFIRLGTQGIPATAATLLSVFVGAVLASILALSLDFDGITQLSATDFGWFALLALIAYPGARLLTYSAISLVGVARATPLGSMRPVFAVILAMSFLGERPNLLMGLGTPVVVAGIVLVISAGNLGRGRIQGQSINKLGYLLALASALAFGTREVVSKHVVTGIAPPLVTSAFGFIIGVMMLAPLSLREVATGFRGVAPRYMLFCLVAGVCQAIAAISVLQALSRAPVIVVSPIYSCSPLVVLVLSHLFLKRLEALNIFLVLGTLLSVSGVVMVIVGAK